MYDEHRGQLVCVVVTVIGREVLPLALALVQRDLNRVAPARVVVRDDEVHGRAADVARDLRQTVGCVR